MILLLSIILILILSKLLKNHQNYFKNRKISYLNSFPLLGAFSDFVLQKKSIYECIVDIYNNPKLKNEKFFGIFVFHKPAIFIKDPKLIKQVLVRDGNFFNDRMLTADKNDPMYSSLATVSNPDWSRIRKSLSPFFTSSKLKAAFCHIDEIGKLLASHIDKKLENGVTEIDVKTLSEHFIIDESANVLFGFNPRALEGNVDEFYKSLHSFAKPSFKRAYELTACFLMQFLFKLIKTEVFGSHFTSFILHLVPKILETRKLSEIQRNDFVDILLELKEKNELTELEICAQSASFLIASYETTSSTLSNIFYELAKNPKIQQKLCEEVEKYFEDNEEISFEAVAHVTILPYLDRVVNEVLRMYTTLPYVDRVCNNPDGYQLGDFKIPPGIPILIPLHALSHDEKYFDDPWSFKPERFDEKFEQGINLPFGLGPRACIGSRLAIISIKTAVLNVLKDFSLKSCQKTPKTLTIHKKAFLIQHEERKIVEFVRN